MSRWKLLSNLVKNKEFFDRLPRSHVITPSRDDVIESRLRLRYSSTCDSYYRDWDDVINLTSKNVFPGWERGVFALESVYRKVDEDAGQVYFERLKGSTTAFIKWNFDFSYCGLLVDEITVRVNYLEGYGGEITTTLAGNNLNKRLRYSKGGEYETYSDLQNSSTITLTVHFIGDYGQVTKLFPQKIMGGTGYPLDIQFRLKPPLESLGRPRILVGLMYSNTQETAVDSRHYKEIEYANRGRGFLHIHVHQARDLPSIKSKTRDTTVKCYLLPNCKKAKCKTRNRKGKDPRWNEDFLIVGVDILRIRREALEVCLVDNSSKQGYMGGIRLSLGHNKVTTEQAERAAKVLKAFGTKLPDNKGKEDIITKSNGSGALKKPVALTNHTQENGEVRMKVDSYEPEARLEPSHGDAKAVHPSLSTGEMFNISSIEELRALDSQSLRSPSSRYTSVDSSFRGIPSQHTSVEMLSVLNGNHSDALGSSAVTMRSTSTSTSCFLSVDGGSTTSAQGGGGRASTPGDTRRLSSVERRRELSLVREVWFTSNASINSSVLKNSSQTSIIKRSSQQSSTPELANQESEGDGAQTESALDVNITAAQEAENIAQYNQENKENNNQEEEVVQEPKPREQRRSSTSCLGKRWSSDRRHSEKKDENIVERDLMDKMMLDAVGLEESQWENMVNRPQKWHYCWQFIRKDMVPLHEQYSMINKKKRK